MLWGPGAVNGPERALVRSVLTGVIEQCNRVKQINDAASWIYQLAKELLHCFQVTDELDRRIDSLEATHLRTMATIEEVFEKLEARQ